MANLSQYIARLEKESQFGEFADLMEKVRTAIICKPKEKPLVGPEEVKQIYELIDSMKPLHGCGFDLFGAVYEMFASSKEKRTSANTSPAAIMHTFLPSCCSEVNSILTRKGNSRCSTPPAIPHISWQSKKTGYKIVLKWLISQYRQIFLNYSSRSDNATWNITGFFKEVKIDIPSYQEQLDTAQKYEHIEQMQTKTKHVLAEIDALFAQQVVT